MPLDNPGISPQQAWQTPTLLNNWVVIGSGLNSPGYWRDSLGVVHLRGSIKSGQSPSLIYTLPLGYRPINEEALQVLYISAAGAYLTGRLDVLADGSVYLVQTAAANVTISSLFLDGLTFRAV